VAADPNAETRGAIQAMVDAKDLAGLEQALGARMAFGTSGLRASMGTGVCCMNELTIIQTTQGLCQYVENVFGEVGKARGIAIGFDHRRMGSLNSHIFAKLSASVFLSRGFKVYLCGGIVATPVVPFCIQEHGCAAGIMVTASHNPKQDNGYKVYWENGAQIIPPHDDGIADLIVKPENLAPWPGNVAAYAAPDAALAAARESGLLIDPTEALSKTYFSAMRERLCFHHADNLAARASGAAVSAAGGAARVVYTAMHGVGHAWTSRSFDAFGLPPYVPVEEQLHPDPDFPTVPFPNPEEGKGALALAVARAKASGAGLILANDPDADRLGAAIEVDGGEWRMLTGDEIGLLLGHWMWTKYKLRKGASLDRGKVAMVGSTVSSKMLRAVAEKEGFRYEEVTPLLPLLPSPSL
jgi:phosphomannomutase